VPMQSAVASTQPHGSAGTEAAAVGARTNCCAATQGACHSCSASHSAPSCNSACSSRVASVASGGSFAALTQELIETMLAKPIPGPAPEVDETGLLRTGLAAAAAATGQAPAPAVDAVVRLVKPASQQEDSKQKAPGQACSHAKPPTLPCKSPSFKEAFGCFMGLKGRVLSPKSSAGKDTMSAAAAAACAANPATAGRSSAS
jgi:hypothetical protein